MTNSLVTIAAAGGGGGAGGTVKNVPTLRRS